MYYSGFGKARSSDTQPSYECRSLSERSIFGEATYYGFSYYDPSLYLNGHSATTWPQNYELQATEACLFTTYNGLLHMHFPSSLATSSECRITSVPLLEWITNLRMIERRTHPLVATSPKNSMPNVLDGAGQRSRRAA